MISNLISRFKKSEASDNRDVLQEINQSLREIKEELRKMSRNYDRLNDTIAEHFEETVDLGEISQSDV